MNLNSSGGDKMQIIEEMENAVASSNTEKIRELISRGIDVNEPLEDGQTFLMIASGSGDLNVAKTLIEAGANVETISYHGDSALYLAASACHQELFEYLALLSSPKLKKLAQENALTGSAFDRSPEVVYFLAKAGTDLNCQSEETRNQTALMIATEARNIEFVKGVLELGADPNIQDIDGMTALMLAAKYRTDIEAKKTEHTSKIQLQLINLLVNAGANLTIDNNDGETSLDLAHKDGSSKISELLTNLGEKSHVNTADDSVPE